MKYRTLSFCFISQTGQVARPILDPSTRYRCYHLAEELQRKGHIVAVYSQEFFKAPNFDYDVYIFHRPHRSSFASARFDDVISLLKQKGKILVADYDDLIFGGKEIAESSSIVKNKHRTKDEAIKIFANNLDGLRAFDKVTCSTRTLATNVSFFNPKAKVQVLPNFIPHSVLDIHTQRQTYKAERPRGSIGYFAGTKSHDKDILVILEPLHRVLIENPDFTFLVVGPVAIPKALAGLPNVIANPVLNYFRLPSLMQSCETVIAPLEDGEFNDSKSRVKFLESAIAGCRLIATPITDMKDVQNESGILFLADNKDEWYDLLSSPPSYTDLDKLRKQNFNFINKQNVADTFLRFIGLV